ncbi:hypothetical protein [Nocardia farcinica]|uniref:hypothetical protein n=1 Tax=Nocardia farcinica TaxID=37329 RepID=UPI0024573ACF|nr:hypothetical protein [Nocardia farcinica]
MSTSEGRPTEDDDEPDIAFPIERGESGVGERAARLCHRIARAVAAAGPSGWDRVDAVFTLTTTTETVRVRYVDEHGRSMRVHPGPEVLAPVREHRRLSAGLGEGPWWRMLFTLTREGAIEVDFDYGDEPFPDDQLFAPEVYAADLEAYPRTRLPVWLAAYIRHDGRQTRTAQQAAAQARADLAEGARAVATDELPALPLLWGRWAVLAAAFVAIGAPRGPRILPALGFFEGRRRCGATLYTLPGGRAVLSGGVWDAPELDAVYNRGAADPRLYRGAPDWVADPVLNPRAGNGLLTFCYWWESDRWCRGESPGPDAFAAALPEVWSAEAVVDRICRLALTDPTADQRAALFALTAAAENAAVTRNTLVAALAGYDGIDFDIDGAYYQLVMAGVTEMPVAAPQIAAP